MLMPQGIGAALLTAPWVVTTALMALLGLHRIQQHLRGPLDQWCLAAGCIYVVVGSGWALFDRLGMRPLEFEPVIVLLTAIHFHYAGFLLPIMTGLALQQCTGGISAAAGVGVIAGVPLVAIGITTTQLGLGPHLECFAALFLSAAATLTAGIHFTLSAKSDAPCSVRACWLIAAVALLTSMALAAMYGSRHLLPFAWLDISLMRAAHGTANALGFGLAGVVGWSVYRSSRRPGGEKSLHE